MTSRPVGRPPTTSRPPATSRPLATRRPVAALLVGGVLAALVAVGEALPPAQPRPARPVPVAVVGAEVVCPDVRQAPPSLRTRVSAGTPSGTPPVPGGPGSAEARALTAESAPVPLALTAPGQVATGLAQELDGDALLVRARGDLAGGLEVEQVTRAASGPPRGLSAVRCEAARTDTWWLGGATTVGDGAVLVLVNPDDGPAVVDVEVLTSTGRADARPGRGLTVGPRSRLAVPLDTLAPDRDLLAVHVVAGRGRVAGAVRHGRTDGRVPRGVDWVPAAGPPSRTVVVPGLPSGPGRRTVLVANPGSEDTVVGLQLATDDGLVVPPGLEAVPVPAGTTVAQEVTETVSGTPAAVRVVSEGGPVLAAALLTDAQYLPGGRPDGPVRDIAWAGAAAPLDGPAVLTDVVLDRPTESTLLLSAFDADAQVRVTPLPVVGRQEAPPAPKTVAVPAGGTVALRLSTFLPPGAVGRLAVEVRPLPGSGPVHASRYLRERGESGPLSTSLVLRSATASVPRPPVVLDPTVG